MAAGLQSSFAMRHTLGNAAILSSGARSNVGMNAAFVNGVSGTSVVVRYACPSTDPINEFYVFMDAFTGTLGNISMDCEIYDTNTTLFRAGANLRDTSTATVMAAGNDQWIKFTFGTPYTPFKNEVLWFCLRNLAAVPATDFPQILTATTIFPRDGILSGNNLPALGGSTTTGFTTTGTILFEMPFVVKQGNNYFGQPLTLANTTFWASNTRKRGIVFTPTNTFNLSAIAFAAYTTFVSGIEIFDNTTGPGGSPLHTITTGGADAEIDELSGWRQVDSTITLTAGTTYKIALTFSSNATNLTVWQIEDYATYSTIFDGLFDGCNMCYGCQDDGAGGWTIDKSVAPGIWLYPASYATGGSKESIFGGRRLVA